MVIDAEFRRWMLLSQTRDIIKRARIQELRKYNITTRESAVLLAIEVYGGNTTSSEIARSLMRQYHTITEITKRMERRGNKKGRVLLALT